VDLLSDNYILNLHKIINCEYDDFRNTNLYELIQKEVSGDSLLDVGAGAGEFMRYCKNKMKVLRIEGVEPNNDLRYLSAQKGTKIDFSDINEVVDAKKRYATITLIDVLEHINNDEEMMEKLENMLENNGRIVIVVPAYPNLYGKRDINCGHYRRYSSRYLIKIVTKLKMNIIKKRYWNMLGVVPYWLYEYIFKKEITNIREKVNRKYIMDIINNMLFMYFKYIENKINFGFGLSLIMVCQKNGK
jgi:ubiquinone/menaquinone biosynthesis C-methylase UbiE